MIMQNYKDDLVKKISDKSLKVGIVGLGYVGLPLILRFADESVPALGIEIDTRKIKNIEAGRSYIKHISAESIVAARKNGMEVTSDFSRAKECDVLILCLPTPLNVHREPDLEIVIETTKSLVPYLREG